MGQIYQLETYDKARIPWRVKFHMDTYSGAVETLKGGSQPILFEFQNSSDDVFDPLHPSQVTLQITVFQNFKFTDLFNPNIMSCWVEIFEGDESSDNEQPFWTGWIDPSQYEEPYDVPPYYLTIVCVDGLSYLSNIKYASQDSLEDTEYYDGRMQESEVFLNILGKIGYTEFIEYIELYESRMLKTTAHSPMDQLFLENDRFFELSCEEVLTAILGKYKARICQKDGIFQIFRPTQTINPLVHGRHFTAVETKTSVSYSPIQYINRTATHPTTLRQIPGGRQMLQNPAKKININFEYGNRESWFDNPNMHEDSYDTFESAFRGWTSTGTIVPIPISRYVKGEDEGVLIIGYTIGHNFKQQTPSDLIFSCADDESFIIEMDYGFYSRIAAPTDGVHSQFFLYQGVVGAGAKYASPKNTDSTDLEWISTVDAIELYQDGVVYGWNGWQTYRGQIDGLQLSTSISIELRCHEMIEGDVYAAFKNIRFYASSSDVVRKSHERDFWERQGIEKHKTVAGKIFALIGNGGVWLNPLPQWTTKKETVLTDNVVAHTYNPVCTAEHGDIIDYDFILGDIVKASVPANDGDTELTNNLMQFTGSLAVEIIESLWEAVQRFVEENYDYFFGIDALITCDQSSAGNVYIYFEAIDGEFSDTTYVTNVSGDVDDLSITTIQEYSAGDVQITRIFISGTDGSITITVGEDTAQMDWFGTDIEDTIDNFVSTVITVGGMTSSKDLVNPEVLVLTGGSIGLEYIVTSDYLSGSLYGEVESPNYQDAVIQANQIDQIEMEGSTGTASIGVWIDASTFYQTIDFDVMFVPSNEWGTSDASSDAAPYRKLLEIVGDEIAGQYSRSKHFIQMPILETGRNPTSLNIMGSFIDDVNEVESGTVRKFVMNRGSYDVRNRKWDLDLIEIIDD